MLSVSGARTMSAGSPLCIWIVEVLFRMFFSDEIYIFERVIIVCYDFLKNNLNFIKIYV